MGTCYLNNNPFVPGNSINPSVITLSETNRAYNRVAVTGINDRDRLYEIKVRGLQTASCPTTGTTNTGNTTTSAATLDTNLSMHIPSLIYKPLLGDAMNLWVDLQFAPAADSSLMWKLNNYGVNP